MDISLEIAQKQLLSQNQIQSLNILEMTNIELNDFLYDEYLENPLIEYTPASGKPIQAHVETDVEEGSAADPNEWKRQLLYQLNPQKFPKEQWRLFQYLIECLDEDGYFHMSAQEVSDRVGCSLELVEQSLCHMKKLDPVGIFSFDLPECLLRQLQVLGIEEENLEKIIEKHLEDVAGGYVNRISRSLEISTLQVNKYIHIIQQLNPKPLQGITFGQEVYITPDVILQFLPGGREISINDNWMGNYEINDYYFKMMQESSDPELTEYFKNRLERSRFLIQSIEQRRSTLLQLVGIIADLQSEYLCCNGRLKPMTMTAVAAESGVHVSTVSRALKGKYLQTEKRGSLLIRDLFSLAVSANHETMNADQIKGTIKTIIEQENPERPYSDQKISELLGEKGLSIARRTIAKYREELQIPSAHDRRFIS